MLRHILTMETSRFFLLQIRLLLVYYCCIASFAIAVAVQTSNISTDQSALLSLKASITSDPQNMIFTNWSTITSICNWAGVTCGASRCRVEVLDLSYFGLAGTIPAELGNLSFLVHLDFTNNSFQGPLPRELARLHWLKFISFGFNNFGGTIPSWFGSFSKLQTLDLYGNQFSGSIPAAIFNLFALQVIDLKNNHLSGSIPAEIGNLKLLKAIYLDNNEFEEIPNQIGYLDLVEHLFVQSNALKGPFPEAVFSMSSLTILNLHGNSLNGRIPDNIYQHLPNIQELYFAHNKFDGPLPSTLWQCKQLLVLSLKGNNFIGSIHKNIGNLTRIKKIYLGYNMFDGPLPSTLWQCKQLLVLSLEGNNFSGSINKNIGNLTGLKKINLGNNKFDGPLPSTLWQCKQLLVLSLKGNNFSGSIHKNIGNLTLIKKIYLGYNNLTGTIPHGVGDLPNLEILSLMVNNLNGLIPSTVFNMSTIRLISITSNNLSGSLPTNLGLAFPNIQEFYASSNKLSGVIPKSISNASNLTDLDLSDNSFYGSIPSSLCALPNLEWLVLESNNFTIDKFTPEVNMLSCLGTLTKLRKLWLSHNPLNSMLPFSLGNLSTSLEYMRLRNCNMSGKIPNDIGNLSSLIFLDLGLNQLSGSIPTTIGRLQKLQGFYLNNNRLQGYVPDELCQLKKLGDLLLQGNQLSGSIPSCLGDLNAALRSLSLGSNLLTSTIPSTLWRLTYILHLDLSSNYLSGLLSEELGNLKVVTDIYLSNNHFSGSIPISIGSLTDLVILNLANNSLEGSIPVTFGECPSLEFLDLSKNNLSGVIPKSLEALSHLRFLNLSINRLQGEIPEGGAFGHLSYESFFSNGELCGSPHLQVPLCPNSTSSTPLCQNRCITILKYIIPGIPFAILIVAFIWRLILHRKRNAKAAKVTTLLPPQPLWRRVSYKELRRATYGFAETNLLGTGGLGSVYRGTLSDGILVAIKVFNVQLEEALTSFDMECKMLSTIRHRNLIKIISCCIDIDFRAVVLSYMPNGSLEKWLYSDNFSLSILQRLNILIDVALALEYLHHGYETMIVHCDLKPSNILLDDDMVAHIADFGIAKLLGGGASMSQTTTLATIGYMAPEYGMGGIVSRRGDVYSFGIILMETFTKRKPTDDMFVGQMNLKQWVANSLLSDAIVEVVDSNLIGTQEEDEDFVSKRFCLSCIMNLAMACCEESPENRMNIQDALSTLNKIKKKFLKDTAGGMLPNFLLFSRRSIEEFYSIFHGL